MKVIGFTVHLQDTWNEETDERVRRGKIQLGDTVLFEKEYSPYGTSEDDVANAFAELVKAALRDRSE